MEILYCFLDFAGWGIFFYRSLHQPLERLSPAAHDCFCERKTLGSSDISDDAIWPVFENGVSTNKQVDYDAGKQVKGRKIQALIDSEGLPMRVVIHSAAIQDHDGARLVPRQETQALSLAQTDLGQWWLQRMAS
jgi:Transposase DDE domain